MPGVLDRIRHRVAAQLGKTKLYDLSQFEKKIFSQNGEDGIIENIFDTIGTTNKYFVEFGVESGAECNTRLLHEQKGWDGLMMDTQDTDDPFIKKELITVENVESIFKKYAVPRKLDLLSIDIDGNDYYVWRAITHYRPRVLIIEYNAHIPVNESKTIVYEPTIQWDGTDYFGASLLALSNLS